MGAGDGVLYLLLSSGTSVAINFTIRNQYKLTKSTAKKIFDPLEGIFALLVRKSLESLHASAALQVFFSTAHSAVLRVKKN